MNGTKDRPARPENAARAYRITTDGRTAIVCAECFHDPKLADAAKAAEATPVDAEDELRGVECTACGNQIIEATPLRAVMEMSNNGVNFEPLEDPSNGSAELLVPEEEEAGLDGTLQLAFERAIGNVIVHPGDTFRIRSIEE